MLGKNCTKVFNHIFSRRLTVKFSGDHSLTPCIQRKKRLTTACHQKIDIEKNIESDNVVVFFELFHLMCHLSNRIKK
jgi:hypothetical protein